MTGRSATTDPSDKPTARSVLDGLHGRWPDDQYLFIEEAPQDSSRQGRKIDALIVSLWKSRGHELDAVEVKVSASDWKRELDNPDKADWWWEHSHRYWIAVPTALAAKVRSELPAAWGLLAVSDGRCKVAVPAPKHDATPLPWGSIVGILRAARLGQMAALAREAIRDPDLVRRRMEAHAAELAKAGDALLGLSKSFKTLTAVPA